MHQGVFQSAPLPAEPVHLNQLLVGDIANEVLKRLFKVVPCCSCFKWGVCRCPQSSECCGGLKVRMLPVFVVAHYVSEVPVCVFIGSVKNSARPSRHGYRSLRACMIGGREYVQMKSQGVMYPLCL